MLRIRNFTQKINVTKTVLFSLIFLWVNLGLCKTSDFREKIDLLYDADPGNTSKYAYEEFKSFSYKLLKYDGLSPNKKVKNVVKDIQKEYLGYFSEQALFPDIYEKKIFNCVTGTALIALMFDELDIPYSIVEVPRHVYMIAYPGTLDIAVESTDQKKGVYNWTDYSLNASLEFLILIDKTTENEIKYKGAEAVVAEHFYVNKTLDFYNLAGIHYYNAAILQCQKQKFEKGLTFIKKGKELYHHQLYDMLHWYILANLIDNTSFEEIAMVDYLSKYYDLIEDEKKDEMVENNLTVALQHALFERKDEAYCDSALVLINNNVQDTSRQKILKSYYYLVKANWAASRQRNKLSLELAEEGIRLNPENKEFEDLIVFGMLNSMNYLSTSDEVTETFEVFLQKYPSLDDNIDFQVAYVGMLLYVASDYIFQDNEEGFEIMDRAFDYMNKKDIDQTDELLIEPLAELHAQLSTYYFRAKEYEKALTEINKALELIPNSESYQNKKSYILEKL